MSQNGDFTTKKSAMKTLAATEVKTPNRPVDVAGFLDCNKGLQGLLFAMRFRTIKQSAHPSVQQIQNFNQNEYLLTYAIDSQLRLSP